VSCKKTATSCAQELWPRFQASSQEILAACRLRIEQCRSTDGFSKSRIRWWVRVARHLLLTFCDLTSGIASLVKKFPDRAPLSRFWLTHPRVP
jgi:hypothetical protein